MVGYPELSQSFSIIIIKPIITTIITVTFLPLLPGHVMTGQGGMDLNLQRADLD